MTLNYFLTMVAPHFGQFCWEQGTPALWGATVPHWGQVHSPPGPAATLGPPILPFRDRPIPDPFPVPEPVLQKGPVPSFPGMSFTSRENVKPHALKGVAVRQSSRP
jgi:hypothetical protein